MRKKPTPHDELLELRSARIVAGLGQSMKGHAERTRRAIIAENKSLDKRMYFRSINEAYQCGGFSVNIVRAICDGKREHFKGWRFRYATKQERKEYELSN